MPTLRGLDDIRESLRAKSNSLPPVHLWNPPYRGELDIRIHRDGTWSYEGSRIERPAIVRLFSTILRLEEDGRYYLVTPVEKIGITVEDAPFLAVAVDVEGSDREQRLIFRTSVEDNVLADADHPIRVAVNQQTGEPSPYVHVRRRLEALIARPVYYELADLCVEHDLEDGPAVGVWSAGVFFPFLPSADLGMPL
ncbi:MAG: DUF1285 domain-containing protein [Alphaproteobacteria bacterium]